MHGVMLIACCGALVALQHETFGPANVNSAHATIVDNWRDDWWENRQRDAIGFGDLSEDLACELARSGDMPPVPAQTDNLRILTDAAIEHAIRAAGGNMSDAARRLGISRNTLYRRRRNGSS